MIILILALGNVWLINKSFPADAKNELPKIKLNLLSAGSFVIQNPAFFQKGGVGSFNEIKNILVLGKSGGRHIAPDLTDTILIVHVNGPLKKIKIISLPRDLAVKTALGAVKINSLYQIGLKESEQKGLELIQKKTEEVTGLAIDSFLLFELDTVEKIIDDIGGLNVLVKNEIYDTRFPTDEGGYEIFKLESGLRYLDGQTALKFIRTRNSSRGDFDRIERQQEVVKALKVKIISLNPVWDFGKLWSVFKTVQKNIRTDLGMEDLKNMRGLAKNVDLEKIETLSLSPENKLVTPGKIGLAYVLFATPQQYDYSEIREAVKKFLMTDF